MTTPTPTPTPTPASVTGQIEQTQVGANGTLVQGMTITFTTGTGTTGSVFVPLAQYNAATVKAMIAAQAAKIDAVAALTHES